MNLSDAATKLKEIISKAAATTSEAKGVFQVLLRFIIDLYDEFLYKQGKFCTLFTLIFYIADQT